MSLNLDQTTITIVAYAGAMGFFVVILLAMFMKNRGKILVRIKNPIQEREIWKKPETHGQVSRIVMKEARGRDPGWYFDFTNKSVIPKKGFLKSYLALDVFPGALHAVNWDYDLSVNDQPRLTRKEAREINFIEGFHARYRDLGKYQISTVLYLLIFANIMIGVFILLVVTGTIKLG